MTATAAAVNGNAMPTEAPSAPKASKEAVNKLIAKYTKADEAVSSAKAALEKATEARATVCKELAATSGKGKYRVNGEIVTLTSRKSKKTEQETFFFKGKNDDDEVLGGD